MEREEEIVKKLSNIESYLGELLSWIKLENRATVQSLLHSEIDTDQKRRVFELLDGKRSQKEIAEAVGVSTRSIFNWLKRWQQTGLVVPSLAAPGKVQRLVSLEDYGFGTYNSKEILEKETLIEDGEIDAGRLKKILSDRKVFPYQSDIGAFAGPILETNFNEYTTIDQLISKVTDVYESSPKFKQRLFVQALEQRLRQEGTSFQDYFESWERQIRG